MIAELEFCKERSVVNLQVVLDLVKINSIAPISGPSVYSQPAIADWAVAICDPAKDVLVDLLADHLVLVPQQDQLGRLCMSGRQGGRPGSSKWHLLLLLAKM